MGDRAAAAEIAASIGRLGFDSAADAYGSARAFAGCLPADGRDDTLRFADRAMGVLRRAVAAGFRDAARIRDDRDLAPLRDRADFRMLLMDLSFPAEAFARPE
jgi:hypothetical protein